MLSTAAVYDNYNGMYYTVDSGYQVHAPITLSGKECVLNKVYVLNKQVFKYMVVALFSGKDNYAFTCTYWLWICVTIHAICTFSIARSLNARLHQQGSQGFNNKNMVRPKCCMVLKSYNDLHLVS